MSKKSDKTKDVESPSKNVSLVKLSDIELGLLYGGEYEMLMRSQNNIQAITNELEKRKELNHAQSKERNDTVA